MAISDQIQRLQKMKEEWENKIKEIDEEIKEQKEKEATERYKKTIDKLGAMNQEVFKTLYDSLEHSKNCENFERLESDEYGNQYCSCKKCLLKEIWNGEWGGTYDFKFEVKIIDNETEKEVEES